MLPYEREIPFRKDTCCERSDRAAKKEPIHNANEVRQVMPDGFTRIIRFAGAHRCNLKGGRSHGIGEMRIWFILLGAKGATQWLLGTGHYLGADGARVSSYRLSGEKDQGPKPDAWDLGYHSPKPIYEGQEPNKECDLLPGGECYYDGSGLNGKPHVEPFLAGGPDYIWGVLREDYDARFGDDA